MQVDETGGQTDSNSFSKWDWCVGEAPPSLRVDGKLHRLCSVLPTVTGHMVLKQ